jgi:hypothetical protein
MAADHEPSREDAMKSSETPLPPAAEDETRALFLERLERLIRMRRDYRDDLNPLGFRLLDRAIDATYQDCIDFGAANEARALLEKRPRPSPGT